MSNSNQPQTNSINYISQMDQIPQKPYEKLRRLKSESIIRPNYPFETKLSKQELKRMKKEENKRKKEERKQKQMEEKLRKKELRLQKKKSIRVVDDQNIVNKPQKSVPKTRSRSKSFKNQKRRPLNLRVEKYQFETRANPETEKKTETETEKKPFSTSQSSPTLPQLLSEKAKIENETTKEMQSKKDQLKNLLLLDNDPYKEPIKNQRNQQKKLNDPQLFLAQDQDNQHSISQANPNGLRLTHALARQVSIDIGSFFQNKEQSLENIKKNQVSISNKKDHIATPTKFRNKKSKKARRKSRKFDIDNKVLLNIVVDENLILIDEFAKEIRTVQNSDQISDILVKLFESEHLLIELLKFSILKEIENTQYISQILKEPIKKFIEDSIIIQNQEFQNENENENENQNNNQEFLNENKKDNKENLIEKVQFLLYTITSQPENCPKYLQEICHFIRTRVHNKFPEMDLRTVGGFFFLRLICPALTNPQEHGITTEKLPSLAQRGLIQASKILQALSNNSTFNEQSSMFSLNEFINEKMDETNKFLETISNSCVVKDLLSVHLNFSEQEIQENLEQLKELLKENPNILKIVEKFKKQKKAF
ncbi:ras gtpase-activating protein [Anaeramoeba ignava]|uniref:Ras gtpase-activating protein n=1 Tax=Anaeramoeba ignava TaxID=1746090 RepID=A0A9Q0LRN9_ANAIG|nr:ras gtpase-activating protein [Anaeramoeba ignava]